MPARAQSRSNRPEERTQCPVLHAVSFCAHSPFSPWRSGSERVLSPPSPEDSGQALRRRVIRDERSAVQRSGSASRESDSMTTRQAQEACLLEFARTAPELPRKCREFPPAPDGGTLGSEEHAELRERCAGRYRPDTSEGLASIQQSPIASTDALPDNDGQSREHPAGSRLSSLPQPHR